MLTHERLLELLSYDPETGVFGWLQHRSRTPAGSVAGSVSSRRYRQIHIDGKGYCAHRLAWFYMTGQWPAEELDHINGVSTDDRFSNLRQASRCQNQRNVGLTCANKSGFKGVHRNHHQPGPPWRASIKVNGRFRHLGAFEDRESAAKVYQQAAMEAFGEFARFI